jgi:hypothetical protein
MIKITANSQTLIYLVTFSEFAVEGIFLGVLFMSALIYLFVSLSLHTRGCRCNPAINELRLDDFDLNLFTVVNYILGKYLGHFQFPCSYNFEIFQEFQRLHN